MQRTTVKLDKILSAPTDVCRLLADKTLAEMFDYCDVRYKELVAARTPRNEKLKRANEEALQIYKEKSYPWKKSSNVKYPLITNACIDFASRIFPAVWKDGDIAQTKYYVDDKDYAAGDRLARYLNYYLAERVPGWCESLDKLAMAYPVNGVMFKKVYYDPSLMTVCSDLVFPQDIFVPNEAPSLRDASFFFHRLTYNRRDIISFIRANIWNGVTEDDFPLGEVADNVTSTDATVRIEDRQPTTYADVYEVVEGFIYWDLDGDNFSEPYIVTFVPRIGKVCRVVPRFDENSILSNAEGKIYQIVPTQFFVDFPFMQSTDGSLYALGLGELLLPINEAVDTSINQLIDAATLNNMSSGWISKSVRLSQGESSFTPGEWKAVNSFTGKLADNILPLPKSEPSATTFQLLETLINAGAQVAGAQQIKDIQIPSNLSATSSMAIIENGMTGLKSVYKRFHRALGQELRLILSWIQKYPDILDYQRIAGQGATITDFDQIGAIIPVSDPNLITTISKATKAQQLQDMAQNGLIDKNLAAMQILDFAGIDPSTVIPKEMSAMDKIAMQTAGAQLDLLKAQTMQALALALRAKDQGIGDLYRANTEGVARSGRALADVRNAMTLKKSKVVGDKVVSEEVVDPSIMPEELLKLAEAVGISFQTPVGKLLGDKLSQSIPEGVEGVQDKQTNEVDPSLMNETVSTEGGLNG